MPNQDVVLCQDTLGFRAQAHGLREGKAELALCKQSSVPDAQIFGLAVGLV